MPLRSSVLFCAAFIFLASVYIVAFNVAVRTDHRAAESRFIALSASGRVKAASTYGLRALALKKEADVDTATFPPLKLKIADTTARAGRFDEAIDLYNQVLMSNWVRSLPELDRAVIEDRLARTSITAGDIDRGVTIYNDFLERAGDAAALSVSEDRGSIEAFYADAIGAAATLFAETLKPTGNNALVSNSSDDKLISAQNMAALGAFFSRREGGRYAAAGLLSTAYSVRRDTLGGDHPDTVQSAMILGPVYRQMGRLSDAETIYLEAFHAQEKTLGSNRPELSLYIKLLAGVYEAQGRGTEAQALNDLMRSIFKDAFGVHRYSASRDRSLDIDRPVSQIFVLEPSYAPADLVAAAKFSVPLSKNADLDEMKTRLAADNGADAREENLPARLAQLLSLCRSETGERLSLRSGYRSYTTQRDLFSRLGHRGTVTPPGMSEHQLGLAIDIDVSSRLMRQSDKSFQCFDENAFRYGFILSYPQGNEYLPTENSYEPWHWRYVGIATAQLYREAGPLNKPQEFLAALPCYEARAAAGGFSLSGQPDVCLEKKTASINESNESAELTSISNEPASAPARKLNNIAADNFDESKR